MIRGREGEGGRERESVCVSEKLRDLVKIDAHEEEAAEGLRNFEARNSQPDPGKSWPEQAIA